MEAFISHYSDFFLVFGLIFLLVSLFFWYKNNLFFLIPSILFTVLLFEVQLEKGFLEQAQSQAKSKLNIELESVSARFEGLVNTNIAKVNAFATYISTNPKLSESEFIAFAKELHGEESLLINFAAAKDLTVNFVFPLKGNEQVIGLNYLSNPKQKADVLKAVNEKKIVVSGPINLIQGGTAYIVRVPIFDTTQSDQSLWGIISAPIDLQKLYESSGLNNLAMKNAIAIKKYDNTSNAQSTLYGSEDIFGKNSHQSITLIIGSEKWLIAAIPNSALDTRNIIISRTLTSIIAIVMCIIAYNRTIQRKERETYNQEISLQHRLLEKIGDVADVSGFLLEENGRILNWNPLCSSILKLNIQFTPNTLDDIQFAFYRGDFIELTLELADAIETNQELNHNIRLAMDSKETSWIKMKVKTFNDTSNSRVFIATLQDISQRISDSETIEFQANYDSLTKLPNKILFLDRLKNSIAESRRNGSTIGILFVDLDRFKPVNDNFGQKWGDELLKLASERIQSCLRESDTVSRISGDEFAVLLPSLKKDSHIEYVAEKIRRELNQSYLIADSEIFCSASIGIAVYPDDGCNPRELLNLADQAMYKAKSQGGNEVHFYTRQMQIESEFRHSLLNQLIKGILKEEINAHYQPIFDLSSMSANKCEALARWNSIEKGQISPAVFIPLAEECGLVDKIDLAVMKRSFETLIDLNEYKKITLSINISPLMLDAVQSIKEEWLEKVRLLCQSNTVVVEITERLLTEDSESVFETLSQLRQYGAKLAIDDFGTGYSSLSYLVKYPINIIKIDKSFIQQIGRERSVEVLVESILLLAKKLKIEVIAEGVETKKQLDFLVDRKCDFGQGYYLAKPMDKDKYIEFVKAS